MRSALLAALLLLGCSDAGEAGPLAAARDETRSTATLTVSSPDFPEGGAIPLRFSAYGAGTSPALTWTGLPAGTKALALMVEDPDASSAKPFVHWLAWNIDPASGALPEGKVPDNISQGRNSRGTIGWFGPRPPSTKPHHYHFQLFALDAPVPLGPSADREQLLAAMKGHVLAKGETVGLFGKP
ncbi:MAG: YbhB/YbcL family Raf kinase inhibitor-like protein [Alphaproteobacteria bacterium]|nr:MAG: YbhB/YbcL family Raf kinase inhibitor-like protein [Alphaproteobacteria bacterium]